MESTGKVAQHEKVFLPIGAAAMALSAQAFDCAS